MLVNKSELLPLSQKGRLTAITCALLNSTGNRIQAKLLRKPCSNLSDSVGTIIDTRMEWDTSSDKPKNSIVLVTDIRSTMDGKPLEVVFHPAEVLARIMKGARFQDRFPDTALACAGRVLLHHPN